MADLEGQISSLESLRDTLQIELSSAQDEVVTARSDIKQFADSAAETQKLYQHELLQHGKSMEALFAVQEQVCGGQECV